MSLDDWLPGSLAGHLLDRLGQPVVRVQHAAGTFASDFAAVLTLADSSSVFVKASGDPARHADYVVEVSIGENLPDGLSTPRLQGWLTHGRWIVLWFEAVNGVLPTQPWQTEAVDAVLATLRWNAERLTPCPVPSLRTIPEMVAGGFSVWRDLMAGRPRALAKSDLDPWTLSNLGRLAQWEGRWADAVAGDTLCHFDPRADNFLIDQSGLAWAVDWSRGCVGAQWIDVATYAVTLAADGYDAERIFSRNTDSITVDPDALNAHLAALAGYWNDAIHQPQGTKSQSLVDYQRRSAKGSLAWLCQRSP